MKLYKLNDRHYINLDAVQYVFVTSDGEYALNLADGSRHLISPHTWEEIKLELFRNEDV